MSTPTQPGYHVDRKERATLITEDGETIATAFAWDKTPAGRWFGSHRDLGHGLICDSREEAEAYLRETIERLRSAPEQDFQPALFELGVADAQPQ